MAVFGGRQLCYSGDYYVVYTTPEEVKEVAEALAKVTKEWTKQRYSEMAADYQDDKSEEDFEYTWNNLTGLQEFFRKAAAANRSVIFTVDQ